MDLLDALFFPETSTIVVRGEACGECREPLPDATVHHVVLPSSSPAVLDLVRDGALNSIRCVVCGYLGYISASCVIVLPESHRTILLLPTLLIVPEEQRALAALKRLLLAEAGADDYQSLPTQRCAWPSEIPASLKASELEVRIAEMQRTDRIQRLTMDPHRRAERFVDQQLVCFYEIEKASAPNTLPERVNLGLQLTAFEEGDWGRELLAGAIERRIGAEPLPERFTTALTAMRASLVDSAERPRAGLVRTDVTSLVAQVSSASRGGMFHTLAQRRAALGAIRRLIARHEEDLALDLGEACLRCDPDDLTGLEGLELILLVGLLLETTNRWGVMDSVRYLTLARRLLPQAGQRASRKALLHAAVARDCLMRCWARSDDWRMCLELKVEAAELYLQAANPEKAVSRAIEAERLARDFEASDFLARAAVVLTVCFGPASGVTNAGPVGLGEPNDYVDAGDVIVNVMPPGQWWSKILNEKEDWAVSYGSIVLMKRPVNYDLAHNRQLYEQQIFNVEYYVPWQESALEDIQPMLATARSKTLRIWRVDAHGELFLSEEDVVDHPIIREIASLQRSEQVSAFSYFMPSLWHWAATTGRNLWLSNQYQAMLARYDGKLPRAHLVAFGFGFGSSCHKTNLAGAQPQELARIATELLEPIIGSGGELAVAEFGPRLGCALIRALGEAVECSGEYERAGLLYRRNIRTALVARPANADFSKQRTLQAFAGSDIGRYLRVNLRRGVPMSNSLLRQMFVLGEATRSPGATQSYLRAKKDAPTTFETVINGYWEQAIVDPGYCQLWFVAAHASFSACAVRLSSDGCGGIAQEVLAWDVPAAAHKTLDDMYATSSSLATIGGAERARALAAVADVRTWAAQLLRPSQTTDSGAAAQRIGVSAQSFLAGLPWPFLVAAGESDGTPQRCIITTFSYATLALAEEAGANRGQRSSISVLVDPLGDLPETKCIGPDVEELSKSFAVEWRTGRQVSKPAVLAAFRAVDCAVYIGHGRQYREREESALLCGFGRRVLPADLRGIVGSRTTADRVVVVLACWGATSAFTRGMDSWEFDGMPHALKSLGADYVVSSLWPVSPRVAVAFARAFVREWSLFKAVPDAFAQAYKSVIDEFGDQVVAIEGCGIQLFA